MLIITSAKHCEVNIITFLYKCNQETVDDMLHIYNAEIFHSEQVSKQTAQHEIRTSRGSKIDTPSNLIYIYCFVRVTML